MESTNKITNDDILKYLPEKQRENFLKNNNNNKNEDLIKSTNIITNNEDKIGKTEKTFDIPEQKFLMKQNLNILGEFDLSDDFLITKKFKSKKKYIKFVPSSTKDEINKDELPIISKKIEYKFLDDFTIRFDNTYFWMLISKKKTDDLVKDFISKFKTHYNWCKLKFAINFMIQKNKINKILLILKSEGLKFKLKRINIEVEKEKSRLEHEKIKFCEKIKEKEKSLEYRNKKTLDEMTILKEKNKEDVEKNKILMEKMGKLELNLKQSEDEKNELLYKINFQSNNFVDHTDSSIGDNEENKVSFFKKRNETDYVTINDKVDDMMRNGRKKWGNWN